MLARIKEHGGTINGVQLEPVSYIVKVLGLRFAPTEEEMRVAIVRDHETFKRHPKEEVNRFFTRSEISRNRSRMMGRYAQTIEKDSIDICRLLALEVGLFKKYIEPFGNKY